MECGILPNITDRLFCTKSTWSILQKKMRKLICILILYFFCSCISLHIVESDLVGTYTGIEGKRNKSMSYSLRLDLNKDGTCVFYKYIDIYKIIGSGRWEIQKDYIIIKYEDIPYSISSALMAGSYMDGTDTIKVYSKNKLKYNNSTLKRCR